MMEGLEGLSDPCGVSKDARSVVGLDAGFQVYGAEVFQPGVDLRVPALQQGPFFAEPIQLVELGVVVLLCDIQSVLGGLNTGFARDACQLGLRAGQAFFQLLQALGQPARYAFGTRDPGSA